MKRILTVIFILLSLNSFAQWSLFPSQQASFYRQPDSSDNWINFYRFINDSIQNTGNGQCLYFNRYPNPHSKNPCYYEPYRQYALRDTLYLDSIFKFGNEYHYYLNGDTFILHSDAAVGQQWIVNCQNGGSSYLQIQITCTAITYDSIPGTHDSVKHFILQTLPASITPVDGFEILLSKNFGLLKFIPFYYLLNQNSLPAIPVVQLRGMKGNGYDFGYHIPGFKEIFSIQPGTVLESYSELHPLGYMYSSSYDISISRDSVTGLQIFGDTLITIIFNREGVGYHVEEPSGQIYDAGSGMGINYSLSFQAAPFDGLLGRSIHELYYSNYWTELTGSCHPCLDSPQPAGVNAVGFIYGVGLTAVAINLDTNSCSFQYYSPFEDIYLASFQSGAGSIYENAGGWEKLFSHFTSVSYCLPGDSGCFIPHLVSGVNSPINISNTISIFPNPATDQVYIHESNTSIHFQKIQLLQLDGKVLKEFLTDNEQKFSVRDIPEGIYIVSIQTNEGVAYSKLLVAH